MNSRFEIIKGSSGKYNYILKAGNGERLLVGTPQKTQELAGSEIEKVREYAQDYRSFLRIKSSNATHFFRLIAPKNITIGTSQMYDSDASMQSGIRAVQSAIKESLLNLVDDPNRLKQCGSVRTYLEVLENLGESKDHVYFFRGHDNFAYKLEPQIYRNHGWIANEDILFKELILRCPSDFVSRESTFQTLVKMQHYSLPTRLLDITMNPLIALYFAAQEGNEKGKMGEVIIFKIPKSEIKYYDSDTVSVIANLSRRPFSFSIPDIEDSKEFNGHDEIALLLHEIRSEKPYFLSKVNKEHLESVVCVKPKLDNPRIIKQEGAFLLFGVSGDKSQYAKIPDHFRDGVYSSILINAQHKETIRNQLKALGITSSSIFPEIERVATYIKDLYEEE